MKNGLVLFTFSKKAISDAHRLTDALNWVVSLSFNGQRQTSLSENLYLENNSINSLVINMDLDAEPIERTLGLMWDENEMRAIFSILDPLSRTNRVPGIIPNAGHLVTKINRWINWVNSLPLLNGLILNRGINPTRSDITAIEH